jgi:pyridinium-3,5-bisthiocarboxylic acid mononucleotide nickel chelatase
MSRVMFIDCFSGAAGDMLLGAFLDAGLPQDALRGALGSLGVGHELRIAPVVRAGVTATKVDVIDTRPAQPAAVAPHTHAHGGATHSHGVDGHRSLKEIRHLIGHSNLSRPARDRAVALFTRLAEVEAAIHNMPVADVHLHEVGAVDSIIDIVGAVFAMEWFAVDVVVASPLNVGSGQVRIAHGVFPVPAPATLRLLTGVPVYSDGPAVELVTPTGALLVSGYATDYGPMPAMTVTHIGYGAGTRDFADRPNVVRVVIGTLATPALGSTPDRESVVKIECEIDDMNPQLFGPASDRLFAAGALDVFLTAVQMKKGRPGVLVTVIAPEARRADLCLLLFRETTTIGVRYERMQRETLDRRWVSVELEGHEVRIKLAERGGEMFSAAPEFADCLRVSTALGRPVKVIQAEALRVWSARNEGHTNSGRPE